MCPCMCMCIYVYAECIWTQDLKSDLIAGLYNHQNFKRQKSHIIVSVTVQSLGIESLIDRFSRFHFESTMRTPAPIWIPSVRSRRQPASPFQCPRLSMVPKNKTHTRTLTQTRLINLSMDFYKKKTVDQPDDIWLCNLCSIHMHVWTYTPSHYNVYLHSGTCCKLQHLPGIWWKRGLFESAHHTCSTPRKADSCVQCPVPSQQGNASWVANVDVCSCQI